MFDYHMHSRVSFDGQDTGLSMARAARNAGLTEICFTDHIDYDPSGTIGNMAFDTAAYNAEYEDLEIPGLKIRLGVECGMTRDNLDQLRKDVNRRDFDFVLGSIHFVDGLDVYMPPFWKGKTVFEAERRCLEETLACVQVHTDYDVLAHLTYIGKTMGHPDPRTVKFSDHRELIDEILRLLADKGKGLELNTSGMDRCGGFLPTADFFRRFKELGGQIVTVGSDAHQCARVGQYSKEACQLLKDIFGYVCTFEGRKPIFHK